MPNFKARARALDMLGRQQIAGLPTAISELFKNAYDAYAAHVEVDYFRKRSLLTLRDDGVGMSAYDFENRWLTLGTESKLEGGSSLEGLFRPPNEPIRQPVGEKGIGRLAIAALGPQLLVMSRAVRKDGLQPLIAAFVNWSAFAIPQIDLHEIQIPMLERSDGSIPTASDIEEMVSSFRRTLVEAAKGRDLLGLEECLAQLDLFTVDPIAEDRLLGDPSLLDGGHGTQFFIMPASGQLARDIDLANRNKTASELQRLLIGFSNTMTPSAGRSRIEASFKDYTTSLDHTELIGETAFWAPSDFVSADHEIHGRFNEFGEFNGTVRIFNGEAKEHKVVWTEAQGRESACGPFELHVGVIQGNRRDSRLDPEQHGLYLAKLDKIAGMYVYRDGLRVLPYGQSDYDWLEIEKRRSQGFTYYFFSYRRMFGAVEITRKNNAALVEKAGREGFIQNAAYRDFRNIVENFFIQIAADFFRTDEIKHALFREGLAEQNRLNKSRDRKENQKREQTSKLRDKVKLAQATLGDDNLKEHVDLVISTALERADSIAKLDDKAEAVKSLLSLETWSLGEIAELESNIEVVKPRGLSLPPTLAESYRAYQSDKNRAIATVLQPAKESLAAIISNVVDAAHLDLDQRARIQNSIDSTIENAERASTAGRKQALDALEALGGKTKDLLRDSYNQFQKSVREVQSEMSKTDFAAQVPSDAVALRVKLEEQLEAASSLNSSLQEGIRDQLTNLLMERDASGDFISDLDAEEDRSNRIVTLESQAEVDLELTQLGMTIGIINHEFTATVNAIRKSLKSLKSWSEINADLLTLYDILQSSFDHLETYLNLFSPLRRRADSKPTIISGKSISDYVRAVFFEKARDEEVELSFSTGFLRKSVTGYRSTFYPAFVNLTDNSFFWLKNTDVKRLIRFDVDGDDFLVSDNGPGIVDGSQEDIFVAGYTRKPGGTGLGLYISRQVLRRSGFNLSVDLKPRLDRGITFRIRRMESKS